MALPCHVIPGTIRTTMIINTQCPPAASRTVTTMMVIIMLIMMTKESHAS